MWDREKILRHDASCGTRTSIADVPDPKGYISGGPRRQFRREGFFLCSRSPGSIKYKPLTVSAGLLR